MDGTWAPLIWRFVRYRDFGCMANLVKSATGTGLFAMPNAFACVGLIIGVIGTLLMGLLITGSLQILMRIHHKMCIQLKKPILTYDEVVVATLTRGARKPWLSAQVATFVNLNNIIRSYCTLMHYTPLNSFYVCTNVLLLKVIIELQ